MGDSDLVLEQQALTHLLYGGEDEYARFIISKSLKNRFDFLKFRPENYAHEPHQHLAEEAKVLLELIKAHRSKEINLKEHLTYIKDLTPYSRSFEVHFNLFKNLALAFSGPKSTQTLQNLIDNMNVIGSVLLQEFDYNRNAVEDTVETVAVLEPNSGKFLLTTPGDKAKLCRFYTPHSTHVIIFARVQTSPTSPLSTPYPFLIQLRDPKTFDLSQGVTMKWLGPSFGGISGREYAFQFKNFPVDADKLLLDKYITYSNRQLLLQDGNDILNYTTRMCLLLEQDQNVEKSIREALKAAFLTIRYANTRTQFQTMDEKGKERPIFEYNYNKTRIMKGLTEMLNLEFVWSTLRKEILTEFLHFQKNPTKMTDMFIFYDMFEAYVNERCLIVIESFRESIGGIGFLKYSGIPTLQENALKVAAYTGPSKELRYLKFAQFFTNLDLKNPGDFISHFAGWLTKGPEFNDISPQNDFHQRVDFFDYYLSKKLLYYRKKVIDSHSIPAIGDHKTILSGITNFENITKLCETFITHLKPFSIANKINVSTSQSNNQVLLTILAVDITINILDDVPFYLAHEGKAWPQNSLNDFNDLLARYIDQLGKKSVEIIESFGFDEVLLHSCICKTADETYETMLRMSKYHNPRNDPKLQDEIRKDLIKFLNRPPNAKL